MKNSFKNKIDSLLSDLEKEMRVISTHRDNIREIMIEVNDIEDSINTAEEYFEDAIELLHTGLDELSRYL